jgi:Family of unknown function (DUF6445)
MPEPLVIFNPDPDIKQVRLTPSISCMVIDDAVLHPERLVEFAVQHRDKLRASPFNAYPGVLFPTPEEISLRLNEFFTLHLRKWFGARRTVRMHSRLSMVTTPPNQLEARQTICHRDSQGVPPNLCLAASVLYLFHDASLGGTSFFLPKKSDYETAVLVHDSSTLSMEEFGAKHHIQRAYFTSSNDFFEKIGTIPAKFNRMIFYDGNLFHSGDISAPEKLNSDPEAGRLSLNGFFTCSRNAR